MRLKVSYSGQARAAAGCGSEDFELPNATTLRELLLAIASRHGERMAALVETAARGAPAVLVFIGGEQVIWEAPPPVLKDGGEVMLVSPISGG